MKISHCAVVMAAAVGVLLPFDVSSMPARKTSHSYQLLSGESITATPCGDEHFHWFEDNAGNTYTNNDNGILIPIGPEEFSQNITRAADRRSKAVSKALNQSGFPTTGSPNVLVILVQFANKSFSFDSDTFVRMMTEEGFSSYGGTGSAYDYFKENSSGIFDPQFKVYGPVTLSQDVSYYGSNDSYGNDIHPDEMVQEACRALNDEIDFKDFDADGDGVVDNVYIFYAGYGENDGGATSTIWPHASTLASYRTSLKLDGVSINKYSCSNELQYGRGTTIAGIGTFCHEFIHVLGIPDLYNTSSSSTSGNYTPDCWSVMDQGSYNNEGYTPPYMTAFERKSLGWINPLTVGSSFTYLPPLQTNTAYIVNTDDSDEYFLLEYRNKKGWDAYLPGTGLLLWQIDYDRSIWNANTVNNTSSHNRVRIIAADGLSKNNERAGVAYPGTSNNSSISKWPVFNATAPTISISGIAETNGYIFMNMDSADGSAPDLPTDISISNIQDQSFKISAKSDAPNLMLSVEKIEDSNRLRILPDWCNTKVELQEPTLVSGLSPNSKYQVYLSSINEQNGLSQRVASEIIETLDPGISYLKAPTPTAEVSESGVRLSWEPVADADAYLLNVYAEKDGAAVTDVLDFSDGVDNLPQGWTSTITGSFSASGYYGDAKPSGTFETTGQYVASPTYDEAISSLSFWIRGRGTDDATFITISGLKDNSWSKLEKLSPIPTEATIHSLDPDLLNDVYAVKIEAAFAGTASARILIDDITVGFGNASVIEYALKDFNVGDTTEYLLTNLDSNTEYSATLTALAGDEESQPSDPVTFTTDKKQGSGVLEIRYDSDVEIFDLLGRKITTVKAGTKPQLEKPGLYILKSANNENNKIIIMN